MIKIGTGEYVNMIMTMNTSNRYAVKINGNAHETFNSQVGITNG